MLGQLIRKLLPARRVRSEPAQERKLWNKHGGIIRVPDDWFERIASYDTPTEVSKPGWICWDTGDGLEWEQTKIISTPLSDHAPDEIQKRFRAYDDDRRRMGYGSIWPNGDVAIHWASGPCTLIPAGGDWERFFVEWAGEY